MRLIAHRGNTDGPSHRENQPLYLLDAIDRGFDVELDVRLINNRFWLGHNGPEYLCNEDFFQKIAPYAWFHCKNIEALEYFNTNYPTFNYFWHQEDDYTLTSCGYIWAYPGKEVTSNSVLVMPENIGSWFMLPVLPHAICSDYPLKYADLV